MKCVILLFFFTVYTYAMDIVFTQAGLFFDPLMPLDLQNKIGKDVFNLIIDCRVNLKKDIDMDGVDRLRNIPLLLGMKFSHEFYSLQQVCQSEIGGKQFLPQELFCLPPEQRIIFTRMKNRSVFLDGNISEQDYNILSKMKNKDILKGLSLRINCLNSELEMFGNILNTSVFIALLACYLKGSWPRVDSKAVIAGMFYVFCKSAIAILHSFNANYSEDEEDWYIKKIKF